MDRYAIKEYERRVDNLTYPVKLKREEKSLLAAKMISIHESTNKNIQDLEQKYQSIYQRKAAALKNLPVTQRRLARQAMALAKKAQAVKEKLKAAGVDLDLYRGEVTVSMSDAEYQQERAKVRAEIDAAKKAQSTYYAELVTVARGLADAHLKAMEERLAKKNAVLANQLAAVGPKALPPATVTVSEIQEVQYGTD